jgi:hypothetical protein
MATRAVGGYLWAAKLTLQLNSERPKQAIKIKLFINDISSNRRYTAEIECWEGARLIFDGIPQAEPTPLAADQQLRTEDLRDNEVLISAPNEKFNRHTAVRIYYANDDQLAVGALSSYPIRLNGSTTPLQMYELTRVKVGDTLHYSNCDTVQIVDVTIDLHEMSGVAACLARSSLLLPHVPGVLLLYWAMQQLTKEHFPWGILGLVLVWTWWVEAVFNPYLLNGGKLLLSKQRRRC